MLDNGTAFQQAWGATFIVVVMEGHHLWLQQEQPIKCKLRFCRKHPLENMFCQVVQFHVARDFELQRTLSFFNKQSIYLVLFSTSCLTNWGGRDMIYCWCFKRLPISWKGSDNSRGKDKLEMRGLILPVKIRNVFFYLFSEQLLFRNW